MADDEMTNAWWDSIADPEIIRPQEAAKLLGISMPTLRKLVLAGAIPVVWIPGLKQIRFEKNELLKVLKGGRHNAKGIQRERATGDSAGGGE